jgi:hypothetical protein
MDELRHAEHIASFQLKSYETTERQYDEDRSRIISVTIGHVEHGQKL